MSVSSSAHNQHRQWETQSDKRDTCSLSPTTAQCSPHDNDANTATASPLPQPQTPPYRPRKPRFRLPHQQRSRPPPKGSSRRRRTPEASRWRRRRWIGWTSRTPRRTRNPRCLRNKARNSLLPNCRSTEPATPNCWPPFQILLPPPFPLRFPRRRKRRCRRACSELLSRRPLPPTRNHRNCLCCLPIEALPSREGCSKRRRSRCTLPPSACRSRTSRRRFRTGRAIRRSQIRRRADVRQIGRRRRESQGRWRLGRR